MSYLELNSEDDAVIGINCQGILACLMLLQRDLSEEL